MIFHGQKNMFFIDINEYPHDPNITCTCLINALVDHARNGCLPPTVYIQCDNCGRKYKNKFLLGFLRYLCIQGYVREVCIIIQFIPIMVLRRRTLNLLLTFPFLIYIQFENLYGQIIVQVFGL